jgi:hypothetical protein
MGGMVVDRFRTPFRARARVRRCGVFGSGSGRVASPQILAPSPSVGRVAA